MGCKNRQYFLKIKIYLLLFQIPFMFVAKVIKPLEFRIPVKQIPEGDMGFFLGCSKLAIHPVYSNIIVTHP